MHLYHSHAMVTHLIPMETSCNAVLVRESTDEETTTEDHNDKLNEPFVPVLYGMESGTFCSHHIDEY
jgi:hypothetical protein